MFDKITKFAVKTGTGKSSDSALNAIDNAMLDAEVGDLNLIRVSSVLPEDIEKIEKFDYDTGDFRACVIAQAVGIMGEAAAGIAYGFRDDGEGGYVAEHTATRKSIDMDEFEEILINKLKNMAESRGVSLEEINTKCTLIEAEEDEYGCSIAVLVYL